jgi:nucleoside-triphosphatase THEP1
MEISIIDQQNAFVSMVHHDVKGSPPNVFLTGGAGCGKTHALKLSIADTLYHHGMDSFVVIAATKMAASLVNGVTYHSFLGLTGREGEDTGQAGKILNNKHELLGRHINNLRETSIFRRIQSTLKIIYVDEVGMMSKDQFDFLNEMLQFSKNNKKPFGGIQIILCGDVLQLPPIVKDDRPGEVFFFESESYATGKFKTVYLETCYRQKDPKFLRILNRMREGCCTEADINTINNEWGSDASRNSALDALKGLQQLYRNERTGLLGIYAQSKIINKANVMFSNETLIKEHKTHIEILEHTLNLQCTQRQFISEIQELATPTPMICEAIKQMERLKNSEAGANVDFNFVMNCENKENDAINNAYGASRMDFNQQENSATRKIVCVNEAEDYCGNDGKVTEAIKDFLTKETKTEQSLAIYIDQRVIFTWNGSSVFTSNNSMAIVKVIKYDTLGKIESVTVEPCTAPGIVPHPVIVTAKLYSENYPDPSGSGQIIQVTRLQFPLKAADCGNAFTTQGISLSIPMLFNGSRLMKESKWARVYVAASRVTDKKYFFTLFKLRSMEIKPNSIALRFDQMLRRTTSNWKF